VRSATLKRAPASGTAPEISSVSRWQGDAHGAGAIERRLGAIARFDRALERPDLRQHQDRRDRERDQQLEQRQAGLAGERAARAHVDAPRR
jgi:hypothetical protein